MADDTSNDNDFFKEHGLQVTEGEVEIGGTYPVYGMITKILDETPGAVVVELNYSIRAHLVALSSAKIELIKERAFEPGIFVGCVVDKEPAVVLNCTTIIFGKKQNSVVQ